jgi:hypothetical protein
LAYHQKPRFRKWIELEEQKNKILKAVESGADDFPDRLLGYLSTALHLPVGWIEQAQWEAVMAAFYRVVQLTACQISLPIFEPTGQEDVKEPWDYDGRTWKFYVHLFAREYGWSVEYIANMRLDDALPCVQEILVQEQLDREFLWTMSERSAYYDDKSKTTKLNPLPRPNWMNKHVDIEDARKTQIPVGMLPAGNGISQSDLIAQATLN